MYVELQLIQQSINLSNHKEFNAALKIALYVEKTLRNRLRSDNKLPSLDSYINFHMCVLGELGFDVTFEEFLLDYNEQSNRLNRLKLATYSDVATVLIRVINDYQMLTKLPLTCSFRAYKSSYFSMLRAQRKSRYS